MFEQKFQEIDESTMLRHTITSALPFIPQVAIDWAVYEAQMQRHVTANELLLKEIQHSCAMLPDQHRATKEQDHARDMLSMAGVALKHFGDLPITIS